MYDDYDTLAKKLELISPHIYPKLFLWNYDILKQLKNRWTPP